MSTKYSPLGIAPRATLAMGAAGAIIGAAISTARNIGKVQEDKITRDEAVKDVLRESGTTGASTAAGTAIVSALGLTGLASLAGLVGVTVGTKYLMDKALDKRAACQAPVQVKAEQEIRIEEKDTKTSSAKTTKAKKTK